MTDNNNATSLSTQPSPSKSPLEGDFFSRSGSLPAEGSPMLTTSEYVQSGGRGRIEKPASSMLALFTTFFRIGLFTIGGGYAMIPLIEAEIVNKHKWIGKTEFLDLIAIAQSCPGVFAINISTFIGYKKRHTAGALCCALGTALPSFLIILLIAMFFHNFQDVPWVASVFAGIRPAVVALIAVPTWNMAVRAKITFINCWIPFITAVLIWGFPDSINPIFIILAAGIGGFLYGQFIKPTE